MKAPIVKLVLLGVFGLFEGMWRQTKSAGGPGLRILNDEETWGAPGLDSETWESYEPINRGSGEQCALLIRFVRQLRPQILIPKTELARDQWLRIAGGWRTLSFLSS